MKGMSFDQAESILAGKDKKKVDNNTYLLRKDADTIVVLHQATEVVTINRDGTYVLNSGGWRTVTTKDRLNVYAPVSVWQQKGVWYVGASNGLVVPFKDRMKVHYNGKLL